MENKGTIFQQPFGRWIEKQNKIPVTPSLAARVMSPLVNPTYNGLWLPAEPRSNSHISEDTR